MEAPKIFRRRQNSWKSKTWLWGCEDISFVAKKFRITYAVLNIVWMYPHLQEQRCLFLSKNFVVSSNFVKEIISDWNHIRCNLENRTLWRCSSWDSIVSEVKYIQYYFKRHCIYYNVKLVAVFTRNFIILIILMNYDRNTRITDNLGLILLKRCSGNNFFSILIDYTAQQKCFLLWHTWGESFSVWRIKWKRLILITYDFNNKSVIDFFKDSYIINWWENSYVPGTSV